MALFEGTRRKPGTRSNTKLIVSGGDSPAERWKVKQDLPKFLITRLQDLRNGTIIQRGIGRVCKSKDGYPYDVILNTFLSNSDSIRWAFKNKNFTNERNKIDTGKSCFS